MGLRMGHCYVVAEIGINHNGDLNLALELIRAAKNAGCDAVKFQKRTIDRVYTPAELRQHRPNPFGDTNGDLKRGLEFTHEVYVRLFQCAAEVGIGCIASVWDRESVDFIDRFGPPFHKIPSPLLTDDDLLRHCRASGRPLVLSTGMSTLDQIDHAVEVVGTENLVLLHCRSAYPCPPNTVNLRAIESLRQRYGCLVGYSGHELGIWPSVGAAVLGSVMIERHLTTDRTNWGSDQSVSLEPHDMGQLVTAIRTLEVSLGNGELGVAECELPALRKLRRVCS